MFWTFILMALLVIIIDTAHADIPARPDIRPFAIGTPFTITSVYGENRKRNGIKYHHEGIDYSVVLDTPILATGDGEIIFSRYAGNYGNLTVIKHTWTVASKNITVFSLYAHQVEFLKLKGTKVKKGEPIGLVGMTGVADGCHIHYGLRDANYTPIFNGTYQIERKRELK
jgi:murein DD-endopeptidase MepM/ murein hydrolase activator NlpD